MKLKQIDNSPDIMKKLAALDEKIPAPNWLKPTLITISVLCLLSVVIGTLLVALNINTADPSIINTANNYMLLFFLPVPFIALAICVYSMMKNYEIKLVPYFSTAIVATAIMLIFGLSTFYTAGLYKHDYAYVDYIEQVTGLTLPENGTISTQTLNQSQTEIGLSVKTYSGIKFTDEAEAEAFKSFVFSQSERWLVPVIDPEKIEYIDSFLPYILEISTSGNSRFLYFNVNDGVLNQLPAKEGLCDLIIIAYDADTQTMRIWEASYYVWAHELPEDSQETPGSNDQTPDNGNGSPEDNNQNPEDNNGNSENPDEAP